MTLTSDLLLPCIGSPGAPRSRTKFYVTGGSGSAIYDASVAASAIGFGSNVFSGQESPYRGQSPTPLRGASPINSRKMSPVNRESSPTFFSGASTPSLLRKGFRSLSSSQSESSIEDNFHDRTTRSHTGLKNLGNTCYMNSIVQCLSNTQPFAAYFVEERHTDYVNPNSPQRGEAAVEFGEVVKALKSGKYQSVAMKDFKVVVGKYNPEFRGCDQHDAHEFLMNIADWLHDDLNLVETKFPPMSEQNHSLTTPDHVAAQEVQTEIALRDNSIVRKLFYGLHRNVITCLTCETRSLTFEPFFVLTLSFPANGRCSLTDLLHHYYKESNIEYNCSKCRCLRECIRKMDIWELPPVLIVHLNRFEQRDFLMTKNPNYVDFPLHHLMLERFVVDSPKAPSQNTDYSLYAVCNHYGTIDGGHYTAFCSSWPPGDSWHKYDDHEVYDLNCNNVKTSAAYVLFYQSSTYVTRSVHVH